MPPSGPLAGRTLSAVRALFGVAMLGAFIIAISPLPVAMPGASGDKIEHILAFYGLTLFATAAFPKTPALQLAVGMSAYGALIEVVQGLDFINRDRDLLDWIADTAAVAAALIPLAFARYRDRP